MSRKFGWSYPPGAANDPAAPYNMEEPPEEFTTYHAVAWCFDCKETIGPLHAEDLGYDIYRVHEMCNVEVVDEWSELHVMDPETGKYHHYREESDGDDDDDE